MPKEKISFTLDGVKYTDIAAYTYGGDSRNSYNVGVSGTAQMIRQWMKQKYPSVPTRNYYWVQSESYSGGDSIRVYLNDAPKEFYEKLNKELNDKFEEGKFDGMTDSYSYNKSAEKSAEGMVIDYGTKYLFVNNYKPSDSDAPSVDWESVLSQKSAPSAPARTNPSGQRPSYPVGEVLKDCAGWTIYKKTLPDGRIVYNAKIKPDTPKNKGDWNEIKGEIYVQTGFKWGRFGAFEKWGVIASEAAVVEILCQILGKYYQGGQDTTPSKEPKQDASLPDVGDRFIVKSEKSGRAYEITKMVAGTVYIKPDGYDDEIPYTFNDVKNNFSEGSWVKIQDEEAAETPAPAPEPESEKNIGLYVNGEFIDNVSSQEEAFKILQDNFGATKLQEMIDKNQAYFNMSKNRVDLIRDSYVYGKKWGVPTKYGNELQFAFIDKGYKVYVSAKQNLLVVYKTEMAKDGIIINDNGGEFNFFRYGYNEDIGTINYIIDDSPVSPVTLAYEIDDISTAFYKNLKEEAPATTGTKSKEDIEKAIRGLQYLADKGNEKAIKAIKGLQYLLNK